MLRVPWTPAPLPPGEGAVAELGTGAQQATHATRSHQQQLTSPSPARVSFPQRRTEVHERVSGWTRWGYTERVAHECQALGPPSEMRARGGPSRPLSSRASWRSQVTRDT